MVSRGAAECERCRRPLPGTEYVCKDCGAELAEALGQAAELVEEAMATAARQTRYGTGGRRGDHELPYNPAALAAVGNAGFVIAHWRRFIVAIRGNPPVEPGRLLGPLCRAGMSCKHISCQHIRTRYVPHPVARSATWLTTQVEWLRHHRQAATAFAALAEACTLLRRTADRPPTMWYAGPCDPDDEQCEGDLYAWPGATTVRCRLCGMGHDAAARKEWLLSAAEEHLADATQAARALTALGVETTPSQVWGWKQRGRLVEHGADPRGRPLYRFGDVHELAVEAAARREASAA